jgi:hypothetical protein
MSTTEIAKMVSKAWKTLPEDEREKWEDMAREDKTRYENEKTLYKGPWKVAIVQPEYKITATSRTSEFLSTSLSSESESSSSLLVSSSSSQQVQTQMQMQMQMQMQNRTTLPRRISIMTEDTTSSNNTATATDTTGVKYYNDALKMKPLLNPSDGDFMDMNMNMNMNNNNINNNININSINNIPSSIRINDDSSVYSIASDSIPTESSDCDFKYNTKMASDIFAISNSIPNEIIPHYFNDGTNGSCDELSAASIIMHYNNNNNNNNRNNNTQDTHDNQLQQQTLLSLSSSLSAIENYNNGIDYRIGPDNFSPPNQQYRFTSPPYNYVRGTLRYQ